MQESLPETAIEGYEEADENPWPHVSRYYAFLGRKESQLKFFCLACRPKSVIINIKAHVSSLGNLKNHMLRYHPLQMEQFQRALTEGSHRGKNR
jgi:hypothetical protein